MASASAIPPRVHDDELADLRERIGRYRRLDVPRELETGAGVDLDWLDALLERWRHGYDWRAHEARIRALPWELTGGDAPIRLVHHRAGPEAPTVLLLHGWPDSILRFDRVVPLLEGCNVVIPALPGFPFSAPTPDRGMSSEHMAHAIAASMASLGYERYVVSAGDIGSNVAEWMLRTHGHAIAAAHLTDVSQGHFLLGAPDDLSSEERAYVERGRAWQAAEGGYNHEQSTKSTTLAVGLGDSPAGLLAWIGEKLWSWTDHDGDLADVLDPDDVLTWVSAYWFTRSIGTSFAPYALRVALPSTRVEAAVPVVLTLFPKDLVNAPRAFAERLFDLRELREHERGGHFAAWERPEEYVAGVRSAIARAAGDAPASPPAAG